MSELPTRRERREQMREERHQRPHRTPPTRGRPPSAAWMILWVVGGVALLLVISQASGFFAPGAPPVDLDDPKYELTNEVIGRQLPDEGNAHIAAGQSGQYGTIPPASGNHWGAPAAPATWGTKDAELRDEVTVHNLEHGGVVIGYKALDAEATQKLKDLVSVLRQNGFTKIILHPYSKMQDARIAVSAWRWQLKLPNYDDVPIVKFVKAHYDGPDAPERGVR